MMFSFGLFIPFNQSLAQNLKITLSAEPSTSVPGQTVKITVKSESPYNNIFEFSVNTGPSQDYSFSDGGTCTMIPNSTGSYNTCSVYFTSSYTEEGTYYIAGLAFEKQEDIPNNPLIFDTTGVSVVVKNPYDTVILSSATTSTTDTTYTPLASLPGVDTTIDTQSSDSNPCPFGNYLNIIIKLVIGFAAVMAMVMIVMGGIEYMTSELVSSKEAGKERIVHAVLGLLLALGSYLILNTINPQLLSVCLNNLPQATIEINGPAAESNEAFVAASKTDLDFLQIYCPGTSTANNRSSELLKIANSFEGKVTYSQNNRNKINKTVPTLYLDCSSFVKQVYKCAGLDFSGDRTSSMFLDNTSISISGNSVNGKELKIGDLLGWKIGESAIFPNVGHVVMYIGDGKTIEVSGSGGTNGAIKSGRSLTFYGDSLKHLINVY